jgi:hypothetical protein
VGGFGASYPQRGLSFSHPDSYKRTALAESNSRGFQENLAFAECSVEILCGTAPRMALPSIYALELHRGSRPYIGARLGQRPQS